MPENATATLSPKPQGAPTILAARDLKFEVVTGYWQQLPKGSVRTEAQLGGPDNVGRLIAENCIRPVSE